MKKIIAIMSVYFLVGCETSPDSMYADTIFDSSSKEIKYFKDARTNKCFAARGYGNAYSFTCVECDSLVMIEINKK